MHIKHTLNKHLIISCFKSTIEIFKRVEGSICVKIQLPFLFSAASHTLSGVKGNLKTESLAFYFRKHYI